MKVRRYTLSNMAQGGNEQAWYSMIEHPHGDFVRYLDVKEAIEKAEFLNWLMESPKPCPFNITLDSHVLATAYRVATGKDSPV